MTERFGLDRKIRRAERYAARSSNDEDASQIFGSNSAYSGLNTNHGVILTRAASNFM
jgi:hypothetical protein